MKIEQQQEFKPITITLETREDANQFWDLLRYGSSKRQGAVKELGDKLSDWLSNEAHL